MGRCGQVAVWAFTSYTYSIALKIQGQRETVRYWLRIMLNISKIQVAAVPLHLISDAPVSRGYLGFIERKLEVFVKMERIYRKLSPQYCLLFSFCNRVRVLIYILKNQLFALKYTLNTLTY